MSPSVVAADSVENGATARPALLWFHLPSKYGTNHRFTDLEGSYSLTMTSTMTGAVSRKLRGFIVSRFCPTMHWACRRRRKR